MEPLKSNFTSQLSKLESLLQGAFSKVFPLLESISIVSCNFSPKIPYDYTCPSAAKFFNSKKQDLISSGINSPKDLALKALDNLDSEASSFVEKFDVNEQGFISIKISDSYLEDMINSLLNQGIQYKSPTPQKVLVDFSSPNIAKEMHVGHLRSTIIGESICRILEFSGHTVLRVNHLGDWGTQFGMLINYMKIAYPDFENNMPNLSDLTTFYKAAKNMFDKDADFKKRSQETVVALQSGDKECLKAWNILCEISKNEFRKLYKRLDISLEDYGESYYNSRIPGAVKECEDKGLVKLDDGAKCIFVKGYEAPFMVVKSDGGYGYDSTDLAAIRYRLLDLKADRIIYITDSGQSQHFMMLFEVAKMAGWLNPPKTTAEHMGFGVILGADGKKFKTRSGDTVKLNDLLDEAFQVAYEGLVSRFKENKEGGKTSLQSEEEIKAAAERVGMAAVKYYDLKQNRISDYRFDYGKMLDFKGNTAVYLIYSYVRLSSILGKAGLDEKTFQSLLVKGFKITHPFERNLIILISKFPETIDLVLQELEIHKLCDLIYSLATKISEGYAKYRIIEDPDQNYRILLCEVLRRIMKTSLNLIGIEPIERI